MLWTNKQTDGPERLTHGLTENAGRENDGQSKSWGVKMQDMKMQDMKFQMSSSFSIFAEPSRGSVQCTITIDNGVSLLHLTIQYS